METLDIIIQYMLSFCRKSLEIAKNLYEYQDYVIATIITLLIVYVLLRIKRYFSPIKLFDNNNGVVSLKKRALLDLIESVCYNMGSLSKPKIKIEVKRKRLYLDISLKIESSQRLVDFTSKLQDEIQIAFIEQLGIEKLGKVNVNISDFRGLRTKPLSFYQKNIDTPKPTAEIPAIKTSETSSASPLNSISSASSASSETSVADSEI